VVNGRAVTTSATVGLKEWEQRIAIAAGFAAQGTTFPQAVRVTANFFLWRPASLPKRVTDHLTEPDLDKLTRALGDGLARVLFPNDKQITEWHCRKHYAEPGTLPRIEVTVEGETDPNIRPRVPHPELRFDDEPTTTDPQDPQT
jgi:Holliday junction resolvase RusA-like endonuclease